MTCKLNVLNIEDQNIKNVQVYSALRQNEGKSLGVWPDVAPCLVFYC